MSKINKILLTSSWLLINSVFANSGNINKTSVDNFNQVNALVTNQQVKNPNELCVVYDMDNTVLTAEPFFGGDHWAVWNSKLSESDTNKVTKWANIKNFHAFEGALRLFITYNLTESDTLITINNIKDKLHHPSIIMTARTFEQYHAGTENQLAVNNLDFSTNPIGKTGNSSTELKLTPNSNHNGFKAYYNGVYYSAEDNKSAELINLIAQQRKLTNNNTLCKNIVFIDNSQKNVDNVYEQFKSNNKINANLTAIHYTFDSKFENLQQPYPDWDSTINSSAAHSFKTFLDSRIIESDIN